MSQYFKGDFLKKIAGHKKKVTIQPGHFSKKAKNLSIFPAIQHPAPPRP
jgi:hypothetical protein